MRYNLMSEGRVGVQGSTALHMRWHAHGCQEHQQGNFQPVKVGWHPLRSRGVRVLAPLVTKGCPTINRHQAAFTPFSGQAQHTTSMMWVRACAAPLLLHSRTLSMHWCLKQRQNALCVSASAAAGCSGLSMVQCADLVGAAAVLQAV